MHACGSEAALIDALKAITGPRGWVEGEAAATYVRDSRGRGAASTPIVMRPGAVDEVSAIAALCARHGVAMIPQGGNTGYMGGAVPRDGEHAIVISLGRLNRVREVDAHNYTLTVEAGCTLAAVQQAAADADRLFPLSMGSEGSCQIGGNLATNAGGTGVLHYGNARDLVLGLEVVLADGRIWHGLRRLRKNNTGYDLRHLFVGAEGTLGIITAAVLKLFPRPADVATALVVLPDLECAVALLSHLRQRGGDLVTAFEYMSGAALELAAGHGQAVPQALAGAGHAALVELSGGTPDARLDAALEQALAEAIDSGLVADAVSASNLSRRRQFWRIREHIPEAMDRSGVSLLFDVSVPVSAIPAFVAAANDALEALVPGIRPAPFGHIGDGNIHYDVLQPAVRDPAGFLAASGAITRTVHDLVDRHQGSFSAEHGIGVLKLDDMCRYRSATEIDMLRAVKHSLDPRGLMNPGKLLP